MQEQVTPLRGYSEEKIFYVYLHKRPTDGSVFYVGKGKQRRAWVKKSRNQHWLNVVNKHGGFDVEIIKEGLTEQEAFALEAETVAKYGIENLTNQTLGGISTTGMRHTEETRKLQREIAIQKLRENPERQVQLNERMMAIHEKQRNDPNYKKFMSDLQKSIHANMTEEEKAEVARRKTEWLKDPEKRALAQARRKESVTDEHRETARQLMNRLWSDPDYRERQREMSSKQWDNPEFKNKLLEIRSKKIVVNRSKVYKCIRDFENEFDVFVCQSLKLFTDRGYVGKIWDGMLIEYYDEAVHTNLNDIGTISFTEATWPTSIGIVVNDSEVYFSPREFATKLGKPDPETTADWLSRKAKQNSSAFGFKLRVATVDELNKEIISRLEKAVNEQQN